VDVLINNAGLNLDGPFLEMAESEWRRVLDTVLTGSFFCSQEFARRFSGEEGHIISIGAVPAIHGRKNGANYCSARAGVMTLTRCLALELAPRIRVNCVTPGWISTEEVMERYGLRQPDSFARAVATVPLGRLGTPDDVAAVIRFLVEEAGYVTGQNFFVDGGKLMR
jgi:acetoacetyl-CoA reductase/3-oxoacyl-[acyl-carrier protein] reductase